MIIYILWCSEVILISYCKQKKNFLSLPVWFSLPVMCIAYVTVCMLEMDRRLDYNKTM